MFLEQIICLLIVNYRIMTLLDLNLLIMQSRKVEFYFHFVDFRIVWY
jgi:hypothetical protein